VSEPLQPQAALEQAVVNLLIRPVEVSKPGLGLAEAECGRTYDGQPPPRCGDVYYAVWSKSGRHSVQRHASGIEEVFTVLVTITLRTARYPFDRWLLPRDDLERRANAVVNLVATDALDYRISREADRLAGLDHGKSLTRPIGFVEALNYEDMSDIEEVGPSWFHAESESDVSEAVGITQMLRFGGNKRIRSLFGV